MRSGSRRAVGSALAALIVLWLAPPALAVGCGGRTATITGTPGRDRIRGTSGSDVISALGGSDLVRGGGGRDRICGGSGADLLEGQGGPDLIRGGAGGDIVEGGPGGDRLQGNGGSDFIDGGGGSDVLAGGGGATDLLRGRGGNDRLFGGGGFDILIGDAGNELFDGGPGRVDLVTMVRARQGVTIDLSTGRASGEGSDRLRRVEDVEGTRFNDVLIGNRRQNFLVPLGGDDAIDGRGGIDQVLFLASLNGVTLDLSSGTATGEGTDTISDVVGAYGSALNDTLVGDDEANFLFGWEGDDTILGGGGDDTLDGDSGTDDADGGDGFDVCARFENGSPPPNCESTSLPSSFGGIRAPGVLDTVHRMLET